MGFIDDQFKEINLHIRHVAQLVVTWYVFFITANLVALGWFVTTDPTRTLITKPVLWMIVTVFIVVNVLSVIALLAVRRYFADENVRLTDLIRIIAGQPPLPDAACTSPVPAALYRRTVSLMNLSLVALMFAWIMYGFLRSCSHV
jgi:hypothetical protein